MDWTTIISSVLSFIFGGGLLMLFTLRPSVKKADAEADKSQSEAKTTELDNVQEAIKIWREMAEGMKAERDEYKASFLEVTQHNTEMATQMDAIRKELAKLSAINNKMVKLLDKITPDNLNEMVDKIKKCHETE